MGTYASGIAAIISGAGHWCEVKYSSKSGFDASLATSEFKISWAPGLSRNRHFLLKMITCFRLSPTYGLAVAIAFCKALSISDGTNEGFRHEDYAAFPWCIAPLNIYRISLWRHHLSTSLLRSLGGRYSRALFALLRFEYQVRLIYRNGESGNGNRERESLKRGIFLNEESLKAGIFKTGNLLI